jgi:hypothetical protein
VEFSVKIFYRNGFGSAHGMFILPNKQNIEFYLNKVLDNKTLIRIPFLDFLIYLYSNKYPPF